MPKFSFLSASWIQASTRKPRVDKLGVHAQGRWFRVSILSPATSQPYHIVCQMLIPPYSGSFSTSLYCTPEMRPVYELYPRPAYPTWLKHNRLYVFSIIRFALSLRQILSADCKPRQHWAFRCKRSIGIPEIGFRFKRSMWKYNPRHMFFTSTISTKFVSIERIMLLNSCQGSRHPPYRTHETNWTRIVAMRRASKRKMMMYRITCAERRGVPETERLWRWSFC